MKHVPEKNGSAVAVVPTDKEQYAALCENIAGHQAFGRLRGKMQGGTLGDVERIVESTDSPTAFCRRWDEYSSDIRVIGNMLARFHRDGWTSASWALERALRDPEFVIEGEDHPMNQIVPVTILILDPKRTFTMLRWIRAGHWMELHLALEGRIAECSELTRDLFEQFPSLEKNLRDGRGEMFHEGHAITSAYREDVIRPFKTTLETLDKSPLNVMYHTYNDHLEIDDEPIGWLVYEEQSAVMAKFTRGEQKLIATWQFRIRKALGRRHAIGLHPEASHQEIEGLNPTNSCAGYHHGFGAVRLTQLDPHTYLERFNKMAGGGYVVDASTRNDPIAFVLLSKDK